LRPKIGGAIALDRLTRDDPVALFLLFSSATTLLGAPGQGAYVAANLALEALARRRRAEGKPALAVAWGPIEDAGYLAERRDARDALARRLGAKPMPAAQALAALPAIDESGLASAGVAETNWNEARRFLPILAAPFFAEVRSDAGSSPGDDSLIERLAELDAEEALALIKTVVAEEAAAFCARRPRASIRFGRPGGDGSLMAVERLALESRLRIDLPVMSWPGHERRLDAKRLAGALSARPQARELINLADVRGRRRRAVHLSRMPQERWRRPKSTRPPRSNAGGGGRESLRIIRGGEGAPPAKAVLCGISSTRGGIGAAARRGCG
jgi:hypothetical protein